MFKDWSIKKLLQFWATATVIIVLVMVLMANFANSLIDSTRHVLSDQILPLGDSSRELSSVATALSSRQKQFLASDNLPMLSQFDDRAILEQQFEQNWLRLSQLFTADEKNKALADSLFSYFQDYLALDSELYFLKQRALELSKRIRQHVDDVDIQSSQIQQQLTQLEELLRRENLVSLRNRIPTLRASVYQLSLFNYRSFTVSHDQTLEQISQQQLAPLKADIESQLATLTRQATGLPRLGRALEKLGYDIQVLISLIVGDEGLFQMHESHLLTKALLNQTEQSALSVMKVLVNQINQLAQGVSVQSQLIISDNAEQADQTRWRIIMLSLLITLGMIGFAWLLFRGISAPLAVIRRSIHALSEGRFDTRISQNNSQNELSLLAKDFNQFADNTEHMIEALNEARQSLQNREQHIRAILNGVPEAILTLSESGTIIDINPVAEQVLGGSVEQLSGQSLLQFFDSLDNVDSIDELAAVATENGEFEGHRLDGTSLSMWVSLSKINSLDNDVWVCVISDVTAWKQADQRLHQLSVEQDAILENAIIGIAFVRERKFVRVNHRFEELFGFVRDEIIGQSTIAIYPNEQAYHQFGEQAYQSLETGESYEAQLELIKQNGDRFWCAVSGKAVDPVHPLDGTIWLFEDVTKQRENEEYLTRLASIDALTGLPNRTVFNDRVAHAIHKAQRDAGRLAVFFLDLDHFKHINDSLGHKAGDVLLGEVANRIKSCLRDGDTVARLGGDEFTLLLEDVRSAEYVGKVAEKVIQAMSRPYSIESTEVTVSPSIGISLYPADGRDVDMLVRNADAAMYHAKKLGRNNFQFYSVEMNAEAAERLAMENALRRAVEQGEFYLHYQAQFDLNSGGLSGVEALLRWHSEEWGDVPPSRFVPMLEDSGLIGQVGEWILQQAIETYLSVRELLSPDFVIAVNLSGRQFKGGTLAGHIRRLLKDTGMPAQNLELEITETMLMEDTELATTTLRELSRMGVSLAIDDFGTGYSSLSYLKQFPLNVLKIDSSFIRDVTSDKDDAAIVGAIMAMSESLGLTVVAEGVETEAQLDYLKQHHCQRAQGYLLSKPVDKKAFISLIQEKFSS